METSSIYLITHSPLNNYIVDPELSQVLTVPVFLTVPLTAFLFENDYFLTFQVLQNRGVYSDTLDSGGTDLNRASVVDEEDFVENKCSVHITFQPVREDGAALFNLKLLTCDFYDCVHVSSFFFEMRGKDKNLRLISQCTLLKYFGEYCKPDIHFISPGLPASSTAL